VSSTAKQQLSRNPQNAGYANPIKTYPVPAVTNEDGTISVPAQPVYGIDPNHEPIDMYLACRTYPTGGVVWSFINDGGIGAAGRTYTVPVGKRWLLMSSVADVTCTATVGNRVILTRVLSQPGGRPIWMGTSSAAVTAAQVGGYDVYFGAPSGISTTVRRNLANTGNTNVQVRDACSITYLPAGWQITLADVAAIDVADAVTWTLCYVEYDQ
jgi:hypothetical protein